MSRSIDERDRDHSRELLKDRTQGSHADPPSDEQGSVSRHLLRREVAVCAYDDRERADRELVRPCRVVAEILDGDAKPATVRVCREAVRVRSPPSPGNEADRQVLAGTRGESLQLVAGQIDRNDARTFVD